MVKAQNDTIIYVTHQLNNQVIKICLDQHHIAAVYALAGCESGFFWEIYSPYGYQSSSDNPIILDSDFSRSFGVDFHGCGYVIGFGVDFIESNVPNETTDETWIHGGKLAELQAVGNDSVDMYSYRWDTGETENIIYKPGGTYVCGISDLCATSYRTKVVKESVEIYRAGIDLATGYNKLTWHVNPVMLGVYDQVKVLWKGSQVAGYASYADGQFIHEGQGSSIQSWNYRLVGITYEGIECPIESYMKGTPHANYYPINNNTMLKMDWTPPFIEEGAPLSIDHIEVYRYEPSSQQLVVVSDYVEANAQEVSFPIESFNNGQAVLGFVFNDGRDGEEISYTNLSEYFDVDGINENSESGAFEVYPNPSNGTFTVEGAVNVTITNIMGQVVAKSYAENGMHTISLSSAGAGVYFISDGILSKKVIIK